MKRLKITVQGQVQGVGFRPHVYRIATELGLTGRVKNNASGVDIEIQGQNIDHFIRRLQAELPPLAEIDTLKHKNILIEKNEKKFTIEKSELGNIKTKIAPDATICDYCLTELFDPHSRYYRYPFINCTHCGPRYTITYHLPYDRSTTSMHSFVMCEHCRSAYQNPLDRRYHAQPIACKKCGPQLSKNISDIANDIRAGKIVALKGLGGYQLICDAKNTNTIQRLRQNKNRATKPFALMVFDLACAKQIVNCTAEDEILLTSRERPIVLLPKKNAVLPDEIAPNLNLLGVMLPYTPIHYLLFDELRESILIVTSANISGSPLIIDDHEAQKKLSSIADVIVSYNRNIVVRVDDSVARIIDKKPVFIRRARGYAPRAITLPYDIPPTLALGGYLKNTICVTRGREAFLSQHIGDLNHAETIQFYRNTISHLLKILDVKPECVAHDYHPDFYSTRIANEFNCPVFSVQHHHAHLAACAAEHGITDNAIGIALDGFGLGEHFESWGGELILYQNTHYQRLGSLKPIMQPGGDRATKEPWRMAASILYELNQSTEIAKRFVKYPQSKLIAELLEKKIHSPLSSSCGRLFDAASALLGICEIANYEAEAAMALESKVTAPFILNSGWTIESNQLNLLPLFEKLLLLNATDGANLFHGTLAAALVEWIGIHAKENNINTVLLSGGCFLNKVLSDCMINQLKARHLTPYFPHQCPPNDGGISLGQAWVAGNKMMEKNKCV